MRGTFLPRTHRFATRVFGTSRARGRRARARSRLDALGCVRRRRRVCARLTFPPRLGSCRNFGRELIVEHHRDDAQSFDERGGMAPCWSLTCLPSSCRHGRPLSTRRACQIRDETAPGENVPAHPGNAGNAPRAYIRSGAGLTGETKRPRRTPGPSRTRTSSSCLPMDQAPTSWPLQAAAEAKVNYSAAGPQRIVPSG